MKYLLITIFSVLTLSSNAQKITYADGDIIIKGETVETIDIILDPGVATIRDKFEDWMDENYDVDLDGKKLLFFDKEMMTANGVVIPEISDRQIDLKVKVDETKKGFTSLNVFASYGYNNWISQSNNPYEFAALRGIVYDFIAEFLPEYYMDKVEESKENLDDLAEEREDMNETLQENKEDIEKLQMENKELMKKLKENQTKIIESKNKIDVRSKEYKTIKKRVSGIKK